MALALAVLGGADRPGPGPGPGSAADRIVAAEKPNLDQADAVGEITELRSRFLRELSSSATPQAYECLLGMLYPKNSPESQAFLREACDHDVSFARARVAYAESVRDTDSDAAGEALRQAWRRNPTDPEVARAYGERQLSAGTKDAAAKAASVLLENATTPEQQAVGNYLMGRLNQKYEDWDAAYDHLTKAAEALPDDAEIGSWWIRLAVARGKIADACTAIGQHAKQPRIQAQLCVALAGALNAAAGRELAPSGGSVDSKTLAWRRQLTAGFDKAQSLIPYGTAWDIERLATWLAVAEGHYAEAWRRFVVRVPGSISRDAPGPAANRFAALSKAIKAAETKPATQSLRALREALQGAGWTAEALQAARRIAGSKSPSAADVNAVARLEAHQSYLATLSELFARGRNRGLGPPPPPPAVLEAVPTPHAVRHPVSGSGTRDPLILYFRQRNQYLSWMAEAWEDRAYRLMAILMEDPAYAIRTSPWPAAIDLIVGEDLIPAGGSAASAVGLWDAVARDHGHVSVCFDSILNEMFVQQADRGARLRLESYFEGDGTTFRSGPFDPGAFSPDVLAVMAQTLFENQKVGACAMERQRLPKPEECREFRTRAIEALVELAAAKEACHLAVESNLDPRHGQKDLDANLYALASSRWPALGLYEAYRNALAGDKGARAAVWDIAVAAADKGFINRGRHPLLQLHSLSDVQILGLARERFEDKE